MVPNGRPPSRRVRNNPSEKMAKRKKTKLTAEFWRRDAQQRANAERILEIRRKEREAEQRSS